MNRAVLKKCLIEVRLLFGACALLMFSFCWLRVYIVSSLESTSFAVIVEQLWDKWGDFLPVPLSQLLSYTGRIAIGYDEPVVVFGMIVFVIARGSDVVSGELGRGTMELLLAQPVSRLQVLYSQALVTVSCVVLLSLATWAGTYAGIQTTSVVEDAPAKSLRIPGLGIEIPLSFAPREKIHVPMRQRVKPLHILPGAVNLCCLGFCLAGISTFVSACDRYRWRTIGILAGFVVVQMIIKIIGRAVEGMDWLINFSILAAYEPQKFISIAVNQSGQTWALQFVDPHGKVLDLGPSGYNLVLLGIGLAAYLAAGLVFHRRDLPA